MLHSLVIKNFRMLEDFKVEKLGRVNLIVGKNNSGKSTVLEALRIYAGDIELSYPESVTNSYNYANNRELLKELVLVGESESKLFNLYTKYPHPKPAATRISNNIEIEPSQIDKKRCAVIPTQFISLEELEQIWKKIELSVDEDIVTQALQIIAPNFQRLAFDGEPANRWIKVRLADFDRPVSLSRLGDGMLRILQIAIQLVSAKGGFLLIDEFENGLHYSVQEKVWELIFTLAEKLDIQVFATTHSWDCVKSFTHVALENETTEGILFHMGKSARQDTYGQVIATVYDKNDLNSMTQADIEVR